MSTAVVIPCSGAKLDRPAPAGELYTGSWHRLARQAADVMVTRNGGQVLILSALHGIVALDTVLEPYDYTMRDVSSRSLFDCRPGNPAGQLGGEARMAHRVREQLNELGVTGVVGLLPGAYARVLGSATVIGFDTSWPLKGCTGVGYQRRVLAALRDRASVDTTPAVR